MYQKRARVWQILPNNLSVARPEKVHLAESALYRIGCKIA
jgi:hypothetical protein